MKIWIYSLGSHPQFLSVKFKPLLLTGQSINTKFDRTHPDKPIKIKRLYNSPSFFLGPRFIKHSHSRSISSAVIVCSTTGLQQNSSRKWKRNRTFQTFYSWCHRAFAQLYLFSSSYLMCGKRGREEHTGFQEKLWFSALLLSSCSLLLITPLSIFSTIATKESKRKLFCSNKTSW